MVKQYFHTQIDNVNVIKLPPRDTVHISNWGNLQNFCWAFINALLRASRWRWNQKYDCTGKLRLRLSFNFKCRENVASDWRSAYEFYTYSKRYLCNLHARPLQRVMQSLCLFVQAMWWVFVVGYETCDWISDSQRYMMPWTNLCSLKSRYMSWVRQLAVTDELNTSWVCWLGNNPYTIKIF